MNPQSSESSRLQWIDLAKGVCIALVVLGHTSDWYIRVLSPMDAGIWELVAEVFRPLRMPLFFMISGMLAVSKIKQPLSKSWDKTGGLYLLYCVWAAVYAIKLSIPAGRDGLPYPELWQIAGIFLLPSILWYIWALPAFYLIAWALQRWLGSKSVYALIPMMILAIIAPWVGHYSEDLLATPLLTIHSRGMAENLIWFYLGLKGRDIILATAERATIQRACVAFLVAILAVTLSQIFAPPHLHLVSIPFVLWAAITGLALVPDGAWTVQPIRKIGRETLPIYVLHTFILTAMSFVIGFLHIQDKIPFEQSIWLNTLPVLICGVIIMLCIYIGRILSAMGLSMFVKPIPPFTRWRLISWPRTKVKQA